MSEPVVSDAPAVANAPAVAVDPAASLLDVQGLVRVFPVGRARLHAVDGVSFRIHAGESVGLVGESGCGKSTLVRLLTRVLDPSDGVIRFAGREIGDIPAARFTTSPDRAAIQMVFQDPTDSLNPRWTAFDVIADPLRRLTGPWTRDRLRARVEELTDMVGLPRPLLGRFPHQLSGGQKARVGIARALGPEPRLLVLDEPTSALDVSVQAVVLRLLDDLRRRLGISYLFVSHDLNVVRLLCDRVMVMYLGKIVESGPVDAVLDRPAHPYTRALADAIPAADPSRRQSAFRLSGEPRSPIDPDPRVCRFHGRCPTGQPVCTASMPQLAEIAPGHHAACHFPPSAGKWCADTGSAGNALPTAAIVPRHHHAREAHACPPPALGVTSSDQRADRDAQRCRLGADHIRPGQGRRQSLRLFFTVGAGDADNPH